MTALDLQACLAGALIDFVGYLSVHPDMPSDVPLENALLAFANKRKLSLVAADVMHWEQTCSTSPQP
jgi:hypothetical protein